MVRVKIKSLYTLQLGESGRNGPGQLIAVQVQVHKIDQVPKASWDGASEAISEQKKVIGVQKARQLGRNGSSELIII